MEMPSGSNRSPSPPLERPSEALSMAGTEQRTIETRKVAILAADGVDDVALAE